MVKNESRRPDRRIAKTKKAICNAFIEIMATKEVNNITIKEIADLADVNRKTVYNYYSSTYDILDEIENNLIESYELVLKDLDLSYNYKNSSKVFETLAIVMSKDLPFYSRLMQMNSNFGFIIKLIKLLKGKIKEALLSQNVLKNPDKVDYITSYIVSGMISAYKYWFASGQIQPIEEYSKEISKLVFYGVSEFVK